MNEQLIPVSSNNSRSSSLVINCRYCFEECKQNVSICKCKGILCKDCFDGEIQLTRERNNRLECTVCKTKYIFAPPTDSLYIKCITCKRLMIPSDKKRYDFNNITRSFIIFNIIYLSSTAIYNIWAALYIKDHFSKETPIGYWIVVIDSVTFIIIPGVNFILQYNEYNGYLYFPFLILII